MQIANVMVAIGGDKGTTVPKYGITASEIAVLRAIHGNDAVFEIDPQGDIDRSDREEIARLRDIYRSPDGGPHAAVRDLFPGAAARAFASLDELSTEDGEALPEEFFKPVTRAKAEPPAKPAKKAKAAAVEQPADDENLFQ